MTNITILGTGAMGSRMAANLLKADYAVTVWNRTAEKTQDLETAGATVAITPKDAVKNADFVISMVRDDEASRQVWLEADSGALGGMKAGAIAIESSTLTPQWVETLAEKCLAHNIPFLDAPVAGTRPQAEAAKLIYMVGGDAETFATAKPLLETLGSVVHHAGATGSGATVKLAVNTLFAVQLATMAELLGSLQASGLDGARAMEIITSTPVCSPAAGLGVKGMLAQKFAPLFPIELVEKDLGYTEATTQMGAVPMAAAARQVFQQAIAQGYGDQNITGVAQLYPPSPMMGLGSDKESDPKQDAET